ncbi:MAG TPA: hypothetical protein VGI30_00435, partial [Caulobacteraceae bacterium]
LCKKIARPLGFRISRDDKRLLAAAATTVIEGRGKSISDPDLNVDYDMYKLAVAMGTPRKRPS